MIQAAAPQLRQPLSLPQQRLFDAIVGWVNQRGYSPTQRELAKEIGLAESNVSRLLARLVRKGYVLHSPGKARGLTVVTDDARFSGMVGTVVRLHGLGQSERQIAVATSCPTALVAMILRSYQRFRWNRDAQRA